MILRLTGHCQGQPSIEEHDIDIFCLFETLRGDKVYKMMS